MVLTFVQPRMFVTVQFHLRSGLAGTCRVGATVSIQPLPVARVVLSSEYVRMQVHSMDPEISDWEEDEETREWRG